MTATPPMITARLFNLRSTCRVALLLVAFSAVTFSTISAHAAERDDSAAVVTNVHFRVSGLQVTISYDLHGDPDAAYSIALMLRRRSDPAFRYEPKALSGDIGVGKYDGLDKEIVWDMGKEFPRGLHGSGYYFVIDARELSSDHSTGILTWLGAGAVAVAAVITYVIVTKNGGPTSAASYPNPPGRP